MASSTYNPETIPKYTSVFPVRISALSTGVDSIQRITGLSRSSDTSNPLILVCSRMAEPQPSGGRPTRPTAGNPLQERPLPAGRRAGLGIKWVPRIMTTLSHPACWTPANVVGATTKVGGVAVARSSDAAIGEHLLNVLPADAKLGGSAPLCRGVLHRRRRPPQPPRDRAGRARAPRRAHAYQPRLKVTAPPPRIGAKFRLLFASISAASDRSFIPS